MKNNLFHVKLIEEITRKIPQRNKLVNVLVDLLNIEKEAVYRRLRAEVPFSFNEVAVISKRLSLSIDELVDITSESVSPFKLRFVEFADPDDADFKVLEQLASFVEFTDNPVSEAAESTNLIPKAWHFQYEHLIRFYLLKWSYQADTSVAPRRFSDFVLTDRMKKFYQEYVNATHHVGHIKYLLDFRLFDYFVTELNYFKSIQLVNQEEVELIKRDLYELLDFMERLTLTGCHESTGNGVQIYISHLNFDSGYSYLQTGAYHISFLKTFILNGVISFDARTFERVKSWIQSQIKSSSLITESGEMDRIRFFVRQREILKTI